jgi:hypothetical protein
MNRCSQIKNSPTSFATLGIRVWAEMWAYVVLREYVALLANLQREFHKEKRIREAASPEARVKNIGWQIIVFY